MSLVDILGARPAFVACFFAAVQLLSREACGVWDILRDVALVLGLLAPFRGAVFIVRHALWGYLALPLLINAAVTVGAGAFAFWLTGRWFPDALSGWANVGRILLAFVVTVPAFLVAYPVISSPFVDVLTERVERIVRGTHPEVPLVSAALEALAHGFAKSLLYLAAIATAALLSIVSGVGSVLGLALGALFVAYDAFDYPLARRRIGFSGKWRYLARHPALTAGFALSAGAFFLLPLAFIAAPPLAAVGATLAYLDLEEVAPDESRKQIS